jgi:hypothetical protein
MVTKETPAPRASVLIGGRFGTEAESVPCAARNAIAFSIPGLFFLFIGRSLKDIKKYIKIGNFVQHILLPHLFLRYIYTISRNMKRIPRFRWIDPVHHRSSIERFKVMVQWLQAAFRQ